MMRTYLITGGAGFIGSHLAEKLLESGERVYSIDNLTTGSARNIAHLTKVYGQRFEQVTGSIEDLDKRGELALLVDLSDCIYHLAASVGVEKVFKEPAQTIANNLGSTSAVLVHAAKKNKRFLFTSTSEVYGKGAENGSPLREDSALVLDSPNKDDLRVSYGLSKLIDEVWLLANFKEDRIRPTIVRLFNTVGPRQTGEYGMVLPRFIEAALDGKPIEVRGDGSQTRCFTYVGDVVDALVGLVDCQKAIGETFNVGSNREISILKLAELVKGRLSSSSDIVFVPYEQAYGRGFRDMMRRVPDTSKIKDFIGWEATKSLEGIIDKTAEWIRSKNT